MRIIHKINGYQHGTLMIVNNLCTLYYFYLFWNDFYAFP